MSDNKDKPIGGTQHPLGTKISGGLVWRTEEGKIVFQMKRIDYQGKGDIYYIFTAHRENMDEEAQPRFDEEVFPMVCGMAKELGIALYDAQEISERLSEACKNELEWEGQKDFNIKLYDHASGEIHTITHGVTLKRVS